jgi:hypothetical protein
VAGLIIDRALAERIEVRPALVRQIDPMTTGTLEYAFTSDRLAGGSDMRVHRTLVGLDRLMSRRNLLGIDYEMRRWFFQPGGDQTSHVLRAGWSRPATRLLDVEVQAGPAITDGRAALDIAATVRHGTRPRDLALSYTRTQTTIIGLSGVADTQSLTASGAVRPRPGLAFRASPGVSHTVYGGRPVVGWRFAFDAERQLRHTLLLRLSYETTAQRGRLAAVPGDVMSRHLVQVSVLLVPRAVGSRQWAVRSGDKPQ